MSNAGQQGGTDGLMKAIAAELMRVSGWLTCCQALASTT